ARDGYIVDEKGCKFACFIN
nr:RecName: Full=Toxin Cm38 [Centruroides margaritatus]